MLSPFSYLRSTTTLHLHGVKYVFIIKAAWTDHYTAE